MNSNLMPGINQQELDYPFMDEQDMIDAGFSIYFKSSVEEDCYDGE